MASPRVATKRNSSSRRPTRTSPSSPTSWPRWSARRTRSSARPARRASIAPCPKRSAHSKPALAQPVGVALSPKPLKHARRWIRRRLASRPRSQPSPARPQPSSKPAPPSNRCAPPSPKLRASWALSSCSLRDLRPNATPRAIWSFASTATSPACSKQLPARPSSATTPPHGPSAPHKPSPSCRRMTRQRRPPASPSLPLWSTRP